MDALIGLIFFTFEGLVVFLLGLICLFQFLTFRMKSSEINDEYKHVELLNSIKELNNNNIDRLDSLEKELEKAIGVLDDIRSNTDRWNIFEKENRKGEIVWWKNYYFGV